MIIHSDQSDECAQISNKVDVEKKILIIRLDNPNFSKPIKMIQNLKDVNISKKSIYNFCSNLNNEEIINLPNVENEKQLALIIFGFISNFNNYLKTSENQKVKSQIIDNENPQNDIYIQTNDEELRELKEEFKEFLDYNLNKHEKSQEESETKAGTDDIVQKINEFLILPKFPSITEVEIVGIDELKNFLELNSNNECFKETITPILKQNYWQINFPLWADKVGYFSSEKIIASLLEIIITLIYQYYKVANIKIIKKEGQKDLNDAIKKIKNKYISLNNYSTFPFLFETIKKAFSPPKGLLCIQLEKYLQSHNIKRDEIIDTREKCEEFIEDILNEFKTEDMIQFREKMEHYFEEITFYNIYDIKGNKFKHIVYKLLRDSIMEFTPLKGLIDNINNIADESYKMNEKCYKYKEMILKETKDFICHELEDFIVRFVDYGSHCSNLNLLESDLDTRLF